MEIDHDVIEALNVLGHQSCFIFTKVDLIKENELQQLLELAALLCPEPT